MCEKTNSSIERKETTEQEIQEELTKQRIRTVNDVFRATLLGGTVALTPGIQSLGKRATSDIVSQVRRFKEFTPDNDPHEEHDFGIIPYMESKSSSPEMIYWKIDYYDLSKEYASPDPSDPEVTHRMLTIMLASEY